MPVLARLEVGPVGDEECGEARSTLVQQRILEGCVMQRRRTLIAKERVLFEKVGTFKYLVSE